MQTLNRIGLTRLAVTSTLAYHTMLLTTAIESLFVKAQDLHAMHDCKTIFRKKVQTSLAFNINSLLIGLWPYSQTLDLPENLGRDEHASLFWRGTSDKVKNVL